VPLVAHDPGSEPAFEDVPAAPVPSVEQLRIAAVQALHAGREAGGGRLDDEVIVGVHQAVRLDAPAELPRGSREHVEEVQPVDVIAEDASVLDAV